MVAGVTAIVLDVPSGGTNISSIPHKVAQEKSNLSEMRVQIIYFLLSYFFLLSLKQDRDHYRKYYFYLFGLNPWILILCSSLYKNASVWNFRNGQPVQLEEILQHSNFGHCENF